MIGVATDTGRARSASTQIADMLEWRSPAGQPSR
jgi:hypothetical protein